MLLNEILEEIQEKAGHYLSEQSIIRKINELQNKLFRNHVKTITVSRLDLANGLSEYPLPSPMGQLLKVLVDGKEIRYGRITESGSNQFYFLLDKTIGLFPTPSKDVARGITLFHYKAPRTLSINDLDAEPDLDTDYHLLLAYGVLEDLTKDQYYKDKYDELLSEMISANQEPEHPQIQEPRW